MFRPTYPPTPDTPSAHSLMVTPGQSQPPACGCQQAPGLPATRRTAPTVGIGTGVVVAVVTGGVVLTALLVAVAVAAVSVAVAAVVLRALLGQRHR